MESESNLKSRSCSASASDPTISGGPFRGTNTTRGRPRHRPATPSPASRRRTALGPAGETATEQEPRLPIRTLHPTRIQITAGSASGLTWLRSCGLDVAPAMDPPSPSPSRPPCLGPRGGVPLAWHDDPTVLRSPDAMKESTGLDLLSCSSAGEGVLAATGGSPGLSATPVCRRATAIPALQAMQARSRTLFTRSDRPYVGTSL